MVQVTPLAAGLGPALAVLSTLLAATHSESAARALLSLYQQEQRHTHPHSLLSLTTYSNHPHPPGQQTVVADDWEPNLLAALLVVWLLVGLVNVARSLLGRAAPRACLAGITLCLGLGLGARTALLSPGPALSLVAATPDWAKLVSPTCWLDAVLLAGISTGALSGTVQAVGTGAGLHWRAGAGMAVGLVTHLLFCCILALASQAGPSPLYSLLSLLLALLSLLACLHVLQSSCRPGCLPLTALLPGLLVSLPAVHSTTAWLPAALPGWATQLPALLLGAAVGGALLCCPAHTTRLPPPRPALAAARLANTLVLPVLAGLAVLLLCRIVLEPGPLHVNIFIPAITIAPLPLTSLAVLVARLVASSRAVDKSGQAELASSYRTFERCDNVVTATSPGFISPARGVEVTEL